MSSDEPKNSAAEARADSPSLPIEEQPTVRLTSADLRHTETPATSVPPVVLPPVAPPSGVAPKKPDTQTAAGTEETLRLPVPGSAAGRRPSPQQPSAQAGPAAPQAPPGPAPRRGPAGPVAPQAAGPVHQQAPAGPVAPQAPSGAAPDARRGTARSQTGPATPQAPGGPSVPVSPGAPRATPEAAPVQPQVSPAPHRPRPTPGAEVTAALTPIPQRPQVAPDAVARPEGVTRAGESASVARPEGVTRAGESASVARPGGVTRAAESAPVATPEGVTRAAEGAPTEARKVVAPAKPEGGRVVPAAAKPSREEAEGPAGAVEGPGVPTDGVDLEAVAAPAPRRMSATTVMIALLLVLFGFTLVVQLKANDGDTTLLTMRQEDLVRLLSDLESQEQRTQAEVAELEDSKESLSSGAEGREAALREASQRADDLGVLAGELPARGAGLVIKINGGDDQVEADDLLNAVQELRGAGAEAMQIEGGDGTAVRIVASTSFQDSAAGQGGDRFGVIVDGRRLTSMYTITVIGDPKTMETALRIPGGVIESIMDNGGNVTPKEEGVVDVSAIHDVTTLRYARPVS
ncbi:DUF881 domain-containing protein [Catenuloplanes sp. NPDC051500]|uniref:DUF881 domain-containing protein n=1 Tax=Catenuloplanes sp. NPDC051500 TaxID=3363959 RepID=UPI0037ADCE89